MSRHRRYNGRPSLAQRQNRMGAAMLAASVAGFVALFGFAYAADKANGVSVSQSLASVGIGRAERPAFPARLIGECNGRILAAESESAFPAGCTWIEPIRTESGR